MNELMLLISKLEKEHVLSREEFIVLINGRTQALTEYLFESSRAIRHSVYGREVFIRGLIEFTNYCKNDCYYCGIRRSNDRADRYRLSPEDILNCCRHGYKLGFRNRCQHCSLRCSIDLFFYFNSQVQRDFVDRCVRCYRP